MHGVHDMNYTSCMSDNADKNNKRTIKSFEPDPDVKTMLERADKDGITLVHICNQAVRAWLTKKGYARKSDQELQRAA